MEAPTCRTAGQLVATVIIITVNAKFTMATSIARVTIATVSSVYHNYPYGVATIVMESVISCSNQCLTND